MSFLSYERHVRPLLFSLDPEAAHNLTLRLLWMLQGMPRVLSKLRDRFNTPCPALTQTLMELTFPKPVGLAAGFDKNYLVPWALQEVLDLGFFEGGSTTWHKQPGNPRPRIWRYPAIQGLTNEMGFNNHGAIHAVWRLMKMKPLMHIPVGGNVGKSKVTDLQDAPKEYARTLANLYPYIDYGVGNVSTPNTPGVRELQEKPRLKATIREMRETGKREAGSWGLQQKPILAKASPDLSDHALREFADVCQEEGIAGMIAGNTTVARVGLPSYVRTQGGYSGGSTFTRTRHMVDVLRRHTSDEFVIIGLGGVCSPEDAYALLKAGANLVQVYTGLIYQGPNFIRNLHQGLLRLMESDGLKHISQTRQAWRVCVH